MINVDAEGRKEALEQAKGDTKTAARAKRMFGNLLGTLQKFTKDEVKQKEVVEKQKVALKKVDFHHTFVFFSTGFFRLRRRMSARRRR